jgi:hypothetical protein
MMLFVERSRNKQHHSSERSFRSLSGAETNRQPKGQVVEEVETIDSVLPKRTGIRKVTSLSEAETNGIDGAKTNAHPKCPVV